MIYLKFVGSGDLDNIIRELRFGIGDFLLSNFS